VASLWKVDDKATSELMRRYYQKLWSETPLPPLDALRQAQLEMLRGADGPAGGEQPGSESGRRSPVYLWASFMLSGKG
jgi:CHAT domain-containing protein